ncbi:hypothetical protein [Nocardia sp. NPDC004722]
MDSNAPELDHSNATEQPFIESADRWQWIEGISITPRLRRNLTKVAAGAALMSLVIGAVAAADTRGDGLAAAANTASVGSTDPATQSYDDQTATAAFVSDDDAQTPGDSPVPGDGTTLDAADSPLQTTDDAAPTDTDNPTTTPVTTTDTPVTTTDAATATQMPGISVDVSARRCDRARSRISLSLIAVSLAVSSSQRLHHPSRPGRGAETAPRHGFPAISIFRRLHPPSTKMSRYRLRLHSRDGSHAVRSPS